MLIVDRQRDMKITLHAKSKVLMHYQEIKNVKFYYFKYYWLHV